jgi:hypothetical protein
LGFIQRSPTANQAETLKRLREAVRRKTAWTLVQRLNSPPWQCSSSQGALCQAVSGPKTDYWNRTLTLFPWFGSEWLLAASKNKVYLKGMKISRYWRHPHTQNRRWHWKLFRSRNSKHVSNSGNIVGLRAQLLKGSTLKATLLYKLLCIQAWGLEYNSFRKLHSHTSYSDIFPVFFFFFFFFFFGNRRMRQLNR